MRLFLSVIPTKMLSKPSSLYIKPTNEIFARYRLATRRQQIDESLEEYFQALKILGKDCHFQAVTAAQYCEESIRDAFISGLQSPIIRQRLLENKTLDLAAAFDQARALDSAQKNSEVYSTAQPSRVVSAAIPDQDSCNEVTVEPASVTAAAGTVCFFCGFSRHPRPKCPAREAMCHKCHKKGHFAKVCRANASTRASASTHSSDHATLATVTSAATPNSLSKAVVKVFIKGTEVDGLIDCGSSESFINLDLVKRLSLTLHHSSGTVSMASTSLSIQTLGFCKVNLRVNGKDYQDVDKIPKEKRATTIKMPH
nr:uncharacterized protein LOC128703986 [Cherax quadricarinatus]